ncbi:MAG: hypothetical protein IKU32_02105 [Clostridia bacterium]|nr:hypothetical protein [Clostridia bacterium]
MKYKVGDKVRVRKDLRVGSAYDHWLVVDAMMKYRGMTVTIAAVGFNFYRIEGDGAGWSWTDEMLEPACAEKIVITTDGVTTTARKYDGKKIVKEAKAVCSKDDTFNFDVGAKLAMERLMAEDKPKLYSGKVVCIEASYYSTGCAGFTKGKIYRFAEGFMLDDDNEVRPATGIPIKSFEDLKKKLCCQWLEVVE